MPFSCLFRLDSQISDAWFSQMLVKYCFEFFMRSENGKT